MLPQKFSPDSHESGVDLPHTAIQYHIMISNLPTQTMNLRSLHRLSVGVVRNGDFDIGRR